MTGEIVNLNKARKAKAKREAKADAQSRRLKFGRGKPETLSQKLDAERATRSLDQHRLERKPPGGTDGED